MNRLIAGAIALLTLLLAAPLAHATSMVKANIAQIMEHTESAFVGKALSTTLVETPQGWADEVSFEVLEPIHNSPAAGSKVTWLQFRMGKEFPMPGMPRYRDGEEFAIFLSGKGRGSNFQAPYALGQGAFRVHRNRDTGEVILRNEFRNTNLLDGIDVEVLAEETVASGERSRGVALSADERKLAVERERVRWSGTSLSTLKLGELRDLCEVVAGIPEPSKRLGTAKPAGQRAVITLEEDHSAHNH